MAKTAERPARRASRGEGSGRRPSRTKPGAGRGEILAAAAHEFTNRGYAGATTAGIARRAGLTQPLVDAVHAVYYLVGVPFPYGFPRRGEAATLALSSVFTRRESSIQALLFTSLRR